MFLLSKKGSLLVLLGLGFLLSLLGPADAIKCLVCHPDETDDMTKCLNEEDCPEKVNSCMNGLYPDPQGTGKTLIHHTCGEPFPKKTEKSAMECPVFTKGKELHCFCFTDNCNSQILTLDENPAGQVTAGTGGGGHHHHGTGTEDKKPKDSGVSGRTSTPSFWLALGAVIAAYLVQQQGPVN